MAIEISDETFESAVLRSEKPVVVDFWKNGCWACYLMAKVLKEIEADLGEKVRIVKLETKAGQRIRNQYKVWFVPTLMIFKNGEPIGRWRAPDFKHVLVEWIERKLAEA